MVAQLPDSTWETATIQVPWPGCNDAPRR